MGQAPAVGRNSLRTFPRNFPGRSGTKDDAVWLCSPETAAASALTGVITDPRDWADTAGMEYPSVRALRSEPVNSAMLEAPPSPQEADTRRAGAGRWHLRSAGPRSAAGHLEGPILLKVGDDVSTDEICPAGARALPYRSDIPRLAEFTFTRIDAGLPATCGRAAEGRRASRRRRATTTGRGRHVSMPRITPRYLGLRAVIAKSFARIHWQNLANFGVLALEFDDNADYDRVQPGDELRLEGLHTALSADAAPTLAVHNTTRDEEYPVHHHLPPNRRRSVLIGGTVPALAAEEAAEGDTAAD